jgi:fatty-acyl-CoA synthase
VNAAEQLTAKVKTLKILAEAGVIRPMRPSRLVRAAETLLRWGPTPAGAYRVSAVRRASKPAVIDERGTLTFAEVQRRTNALANALGERGIAPGDSVALMCRNHRGIVEATIALSKLGAHALYLNTMFAAPQVTAVCEREQPKAIIYDSDLAEVVADAAQGRKRFVAWVEEGDRPEDPSLEQLIADGDPTEPAPPPVKSRVIILTSGTTGTPKGAKRSQPKSLQPAAAMFSRIPMRAEQRILVAAPLFHTWGLGNFQLGMALGSALILRRRFDPEGTLAAIQEHRAEVLIVVPVMLQRILELPDEVLDRYDTRSLKIIASSGSALPGPLATRVMDRFGDILYNLYGSTEVSWATIATPKDLRDAPGTAGKPPFGTVVRLYDEEGREVPQGKSGRIFVGNDLLFEGYTSGAGKDVIDGLMATGDIGHFDSEGRLFIDGRDDEMIVSGGENVFPREVEDLLSHHDDIEEVAVIGVDDEEFGQRLRAFVVRREGATLDEDEVKAYVKRNLASFKVPRDVIFLEELPRNATGKVLKRVLRDYEAAGARKSDD